MRDELSERFSRAFGDNAVVMGAVAISTFFIGFGGGVIFPILPNLGTVLGISPFLVGVILSANRFTRLFANAPAGSLVDRIGTRTPFVVGMAIQSVGTAGYVVAFLLPFPTAWFLSARVLWGIGSAFVFATALTIAADVSTGDSRGASMGLIRGGILFGFPTGVVLGGLVSELYRRNRPSASGLDPEGEGRRKIKQATVATVDIVRNPQRRIKDLNPTLTETNWKCDSSQNPRL